MIIQEPIGEKYYGSKTLYALPETLGVYNDRRGWLIPDNEDPNREGYVVQYEDGYISWSPKEVFDDAYRKVSALTFGQAIEALKQGNRVARQGWNGKGMFLFLVPGSEFSVNRPPLLGIYPEGTLIRYNSHIDMKVADGSVFPWSPNQLDTLSEDWCIVD